MEIKIQSLFLTISTSRASSRRKQNMNQPSEKKEIFWMKLINRKTRNSRKKLRKQEQYNHSSNLKLLFRSQRRRKKSQRRREKSQRRRNKSQRRRKKSQSQKLNPKSPRKYRRQWKFLNLRERCSFIRA